MNHSLKPWGVQRNFETLARRFPLMPNDLHFGGLVTALPSSPVDGHIVMYDTGTDGVVWMLRYDAASASSYKWQFIGGSEILSQHNDQTVAGATNTAYADTTNLAAITLPLAGDYLIEIQATPFSSTAGTWSALLSYKVGASAAADQFAAQAMTGGSAAYAVAKKSKHDGCAAGAVIQPQHKQSVVTATDYYRTRLGVIPVRVG